ncbi:MAG: DUF2865 domain-containing protein [Oricola sp.]
MFVLTLSPATADTCTDLRAQISALSQPGSGSTAQVRRYADAARQQAGEIQKTLAIQEAQGCFRDPTAACQALNRTIQQMKANLDALERQRDRLTVNRNVTRVRALEARLDAAGCNDPRPVVNEQELRPSVTVIPDGNAANTGNPDDPNRITRVIVRDGIGRERMLETPTDSNGALIFDNPDAVAVPNLYGTYRTLCVRTCDGYYFPVSFSTTSQLFARDAETCNAMCPATETKLYFHRVPDEESEAMVSLAGEPYTALPTAFLYRQRRTDKADPSCTCGKPLTRAALTPDQEPAAADGQANAMPVPGKKPDGLADPESQINASTGLTGDRIREMVGAVTTGQVHAEDTSRNVRVVGPEFLPDPGEAIDLRSPGQTSSP